MMIQVIQDPRLEDAARFIKEALSSKSLVLIIGECRVDYEGRGASRLESGERVVLIKQDGSVLVHRPMGHSPVNWQPSSSVIEVAYRDGIGLTLFAIRDKPREFLTIVFTRVSIVIAGVLRDMGEFVMYVDEGEIRDLIADDPDIIESGLKIIDVEKPIGDGYVDLLGMDSQGRPVLIELKRVTATREAVLQLYRYIEAYKSQHGVSPRGILVAPAFSPTAIETAIRLGIDYRHLDLKKAWELIKRKQSKKKTLMEYLSRSENEEPH